MAEETITAQTPEIDPGMSVMPEGPGLMDVPTVIPELDSTASTLASAVSFAKKTWKDGSGGGTPITAAELNRLEQGVADLTSAVNALRDSVSHIFGMQEQAADANDLAAGVWRLTPNTKNGINAYGIMLQIGDDPNSYVMQIAMKIIDKSVSTRGKLESAWSEWQKL